LKYLEHRHSELKLIELFPERDAEAFDKFNEYTENPEYDDYIVIIRNVWANYTENKMSAFKDIEYWRKNCNLENKYPSAHWPVGNPVKNNFFTLRDTLDRIENPDHGANSMIFDLVLLEGDEFIYESYKDLWTSLDSELADRLLNPERKGNSHTFLYWGQQMHTALHAAFMADYFFQVANAKEWKFVHKRYFPYLGARRSDFGTIQTPGYFVNNYESPGIPHTTVETHPGDLLYFPTFHAHEVWNLHPDRLGYGVGIRPNRQSFSFGEPWFPLKFYNYFSFPLAVKYHLMQKYVKAEGGNLNKKKFCTGMYDNQYGYAYNGTQLARFDYKIIDGKCHFLEKDKSYQIKEMAGEWSITDWHPIEGSGVVY